MLQRERAGGAIDLMQQDINVINTTNNKLYNNNNSLYEYWKRTDYLWL